MTSETELAPEKIEMVPPPAGRRLGWPVFTVGAVAALGLFSLWLGPVALVAPWDNFILLDGGYRITAGQVPGTDFGNAIGPLVYVLVSLGMRLQTVPSLAAVTYGCLLFLPLAAGAAWYVARRRLPAGYAAGFTVFAALLVVSVRPPGYSPGTTTYAMLYNKFGWVLYATVLLATLIAPRSRRVRVDGVVLGVLLGLLAYDKANFFLMAVAAVVLGLALRTVPVRVLPGALAGFVVVVLGFWAGFGIGPGGYAHDVVTAVAAQGGGKRLGMLLHSVAYNAPVGGLALLVVVGLLYRARRRGEPAGWRLLVVTVFVLGSSVVISAADSPEKSDLAAFAVVPLVLVAALKPELPRRAGGDGHGRLPVPLLGGLALLLVATTAPIAGKDALALGISATRRGVVATPPASQRIDSPHLGDFVVPADAAWQTAYRSAHDVPAMLDDGLALLRRHVGPGGHVFSMSLANPFQFALDLPPTTGGPLWWDLGISFDTDTDTYPAPDQVFADVQWVMVPKLRSGEGCCQDTVETMTRLYGGYLAQRFRPVESTGDWTLLARR